MIKKLIPKSVKRLYHLLWAFSGILRYGRPSKKMKIIGVTGTDGKTTTTTFLYQILKQSGLRVGMINGLQFVLPSKQWKNHSDNSTPGKFIIRKFLRDALKEQCDVVILEVTSWGIEQYRVFGIAFDVAVITNFTYEHLDLHGSMERYRAMKGKLFEALQSPRKPNQPKVSVVNADDQEADFFANFQADQIIKYSREQDQGVWADEVKETDKLHFRLHYQDQLLPVSLNVRGAFNVSNALAATGAAMAVGISLEDCVKGLQSLQRVPGRMEFVDKGQPFSVIVDFAHTPNGFRSVFEAVRKMIGKDHRLIAVYGATGGRDRGRRPMVGEIAGELVDYSVLTSEDPRTEDPEAIAQEIIVGLERKGKEKDQDYCFIKDRAQAITAACKMAEPGDAVVLCSMGDYDVMYVGEGKVKWSDREAAAAGLAQLGYPKEV